MNYSICISGAVGGKTVAADKDLAAALGRAVAKHGHTTITGATVGLPYYAAKAAKAVGGMSIGFSPATSLREHLHKYRLPIGVFDFINFTGMNYVGRDVHMVLSSDAVITVGGRIGTIHEFATASLAHTPCGVLTGSGGAADELVRLMDSLEIPNKQMVIFDNNPERLVQKVIELLDKDYADIDLKDELARWYLDGDAPHAG